MPCPTRNRSAKLLIYIGINISRGLISESAPSKKAHRSAPSNEFGRRGGISYRPTEHLCRFGWCRQACGASYHVRLGGNRA